MAIIIICSADAAVDTMEYAYAETSQTSHQQHLGLDQTAQKFLIFDGPVGSWSLVALIFFGLLVA